MYALNLATLQLQSDKPISEEMRRQALAELRKVAREFQGALTVDMTLKIVVPKD